MICRYVTFCGVALLFFFFQAEDGIRDIGVTGVQTCALPIWSVHGESVLFLTKRRAVRIPTPPTMVNHRNYVASVSRLGRWLAEQAEELGVTILPETSAEQRLIDGGLGVGVRTGDRGRGRSGEALGN